MEELLLVSRVSINPMEELLLGPRVSINPMEELSIPRVIINPMEELSRPKDTNKKNGRAKIKESRIDPQIKSAHIGFWDQARFFYCLQIFTP